MCRSKKIAPRASGSRWWVPWFVLLVACAKSPPTFDPLAPWGEVDPALAARFEMALEQARAEQNLPGLAMAVAYRDSQKLWVSATGYSNLDTQTLWLPTDQSRIGSVTKTFTAALILQLVDEGVVSLDDPIEMWVPGWYAGPTLKHLLGHTSGIVSYNYVGSFDESRAWTPTELVQWAYDQEPTLRFAPGTQYEYSNTNFVLLGLVYEAAVGESYADGLRTRFFEPLGLSDTRLALTGDDSPRLVRSYSGMPPVDVTASADPSFGWAAGALVTTPTDLATWIVALYGGDVLSADTFALMVTPNTVSTQGQGQYGLGTFYEGDGTYTLYGHGGGIAGYASYAYYLKERKVALIMLSNLRGTDLRAAQSHGWAAVLGIEYP